MMHEIRWTNTAKEEYASLLINVYSKSVDAAIDLDERMEVLQDRLLLFKSFCPPHKTISTMRRCVETPYISLVYDVLDNEIIIVSVFDSRSAHPLN